MLIALTKNKGLMLDKSMKGMPDKIVNFINPEASGKVCAIGGNYEILKHATLSHKGKILLYFVAAARVDTSCCGYTGMLYAIVPGYIGEDGADFILEESIKARPIEDDEQPQIARLLKIKEHVTQIHFLGYGDSRKILY